MYLGHMVELASKDELFDNPLHPYTKALLDVIPRIRHERIQDKKILEGDVPSPTEPAPGLRLPHALPAVHEGLRRARARDARGHAGAPLRVPPL